MTKETLPYSIYVNHRPLRIAFFVNPEGDIKWFDQIIAYNRGKWGGRYNPIILTDGNQIDEKWWKFLRDYDPDIIYSSVLIQEDLQKKILTFLTPLEIENSRDGQPPIDISSDPISILPTKRNLQEIGHGLFSEEYQLVLFEITETTPETIRLFLNINFGVLEDNQRTPIYLKKALQGLRTKKYVIKDFDTLNIALLDLGEFHNRAVYPAQICSITDSVKDVEYNAINEKFAIIIGDTAEELSYFWNRTMIVPKWMRKGLNQLWLSNELARNEIIRPGLAKFINRYVDETGNQNYRGVHFVTFSLVENAIKAISNSFTNKLHHPRSYAKYDQPQIPDYGQNKRFFFLRQGLELYRGHSQEEHLVLSEPDQEEGIMAGQSWCADLYIQFRPEIFTNIQGIQYWWQLPKRNSILADLHFFNKPARINEYGMFSVMMRRRSRFQPDENILIVKLPSDRSIFASLICGERFDCIDQDPRQRFLSRPYSDIQRSDKGMYLAGVLSLFPDMLNAHALLEERYWRQMFGKMSNQDASKDEKKKTDIFNRLKKTIVKRHDFIASEDGMKWLTEQVFIFARELSKRDIDLAYEDFEEEAQKETDECNQQNPTNPIPFDRSMFNDTLSELIDWNVLLVGIKPKCPRCGYRIWYHLDEASQQIDCRGCGCRYSVDAKEKWQYRLNSLLKAAFSEHGTIPVLLVLGQLLRDARSSFVYFPSIELLRHSEDYEKIQCLGEIDLLCIKDGQFIIGEIKQTVRLFRSDDFNKMGDIAEKIKPDVIIFSSMDIEPNAAVKENINILRERLKYLEIEVNWYALHDWVFKASPVH